MLCSRRVPVLSLAANARHRPSTTQGLRAAIPAFHSTQSAGRGSGGDGRGRGRGRGVDSFKNFMKKRGGIPPRPPAPEGQNSREEPIAGGGGAQQTNASRGGGRGRGRGRGGGGRGRGRGGGNFARDERRDAPSKQPVKPRIITFKDGQFDDMEVGSSKGDTSEMLAELVAQTEQTEDGLLIFDMEASPELMEKMTDAVDKPKSARSLDQLLKYGMLDAALGEDIASTAPQKVHEVWETTAANPYITHAQRVEVVEHLEREMRTLEADLGEDLLERSLMLPSELE